MLLNRASQLFALDRGARAPTGESDVDPVERVVRTPNEDVWATTRQSHLALGSAAPGDPSDAGDDLAIVDRVCDLLDFEVVGARPMGFGPRFAGAFAARKRAIRDVD